ncbi:MAG: cysteine peptidase family C39 domain-containing protein [Alphaproteobacteria bacterium]|nr:cysteine peptidase family C39 domain-containing protein [Alphaproteobacteria bacterium]
MKTFGRRTRLVLQMESAECGAACLAMVMSAHGRDITLEEARARCGTSRDGIDAAALVRAAESYGLDTKALAREPESLADLPLPAILHWNFDHFVVLESVRGSHFVLLDPATGKRTVDRTEMGRGFTGLALAFAPGEAFEPGGTRPSVMRAMLQQASGSRDALLIVSVCGVAGIVPGLALSGAVQTYAEQVIGEGRKEWFFVIVAALLGIIAVQMTLAVLREWTVAALKTKIAASVAARAFEHALFLPLAFFAQRNAGEVVSRLRIGSEIGGTVAGPLAQLLPNTIVALGYLAIMTAYDAVLGAVAAAVAAVTLLLLVDLSGRLTEATRLQAVLEGNASGVATAGFMAFGAFRLLGRENLFARRWMTAEEAALDAEQRLGLIKTLATVGPASLSLFITICVLSVGSVRAMAGDLTIGDLMALQVLAGLLAAPIASIAEHYCGLQEAAGALARLDDVIEHPADTIVRRRADRAGEDRHDGAVAAAGLQLRDLRFGYGTGPDLFSNVSFDLEPGVLTAVTGPSGSGKSTLARIAAGMLAPRAGRVLFAERPLDEWLHDDLRRRLLYVPQSSAVLTASIRENITMWDETIDAAAIEEALDLVGATEVVARAGGLGARLSSHEPSLSGGEIQRLALARAIVRRPDVLILDEITSALDPLCEQRVLAGLRRSGAAVLLVTHRRGSVRRCDRVLALDGRGGMTIRDGVSDGVEAPLYGPKSVHPGSTA